MPSESPTSARDVPPVGKNELSMFLAGVVFALGLGVAGMTDANRVIAFLELGPQWDPSLAFVMGGAIAVHAILFRVILRRPSPLYDGDFHLPGRGEIDRRLLLGSVLFGVGWGLGGYCPGPAVVATMAFDPTTLAFMASMLLGMVIFRRTNRTQDDSN